MKTDRANAFQKLLLFASISSLRYHYPFFGETSKPYKAYSAFRLFNRHMSTDTPWIEPYDKFLEQINSLKEYARARALVNRNVGLPSDVSEQITAFILRHNGDYTCRKPRIGDLESDTQGKIEVKSFTTDGATSFGSKTKWDVLYFLDAKRWRDDWYRLYRIPVPHDSIIWQELEFSKDSTFAQKIETQHARATPVRPRTQFSNICAQLCTKDPRLCEIVFEGHLTREICAPTQSPAPAPADDKLRMVDLCAGTGAFSIAFQSCGVRPVFANDMSVTAVRQYELNLRNHPITAGNLLEIDVATIPAHDILTAGFPCQPFSVAGEKNGFEDSRSNVFFKILEIIQVHRPACVLLENVKGILTHDPFPSGNRDDNATVPDCLRGFKRVGRTITTIVQSLEKERYGVQVALFNTSVVTGIPQHRERVFVIAFLDQKCTIQLDVSAQPKRPVTDFLDSTIAPKYYYSPSTCKREIYEQIAGTVKEPGTVYQYRRTAVRENKSAECPTLTANMGAGGHNVPLVRDAHGVRKLTPRECFRLQGFPDTYLLSRVLSEGSLYKLAGNAVTLPVVRMLAQRISEALRGVSSRNNATNA